MTIIKPEELVRPPETLTEVTPGPQPRGWRLRPENNYGSQRAQVGEADGLHRQANHQSSARVSSVGDGDARPRPPDHRRRGRVVCQPHGTR